MKFERNEKTEWKGIDLKNGGFSSKPEYIYDTFFAKDTTILEDEFFITQGFERNTRSTSGHGNCISRDSCGKYIRW
jgi:hypothetical protein